MKNVICSEIRVTRRSGKRAVFPLPWLSPLGVRQRASTFMFKGDEEQDKG